MGGRAKRARYKGRRGFFPIVTSNISFEVVVCEGCNLGAELYKWLAEV